MRILTQLRGINLTGLRLDALVPSNRLTVIRLTDKRYIWECRCECSNICYVNEHNLRTGHTQSCGCYQRSQASKAKTTHGKCHTRVYTTWCSIHRRCYNESQQNYKYYGGRGIIVCERWFVFANFYQDMGDPTFGMTLERKDNDGNYTPDNCEWATPQEQANNRRGNRLLTDGLQIKTLAEWTRELGMSRVDVVNQLETIIFE